MIKEIGKKGKMYMMSFYRFGVNFNVLKFLRKAGIQKPNGMIEFVSKKIKYPIYLRQDNSDVGVFDQIFLSMEYGINVDFEPKVILDCGANIGLAAVYFKNRFPVSKIICIEPELGNYNLLVKNTERYDDIITCNAGIWRCSSHLCIEDNGYGDWGFMVKEVDENTPNSIVGLSLEDIMKENDIQTIDILKIDIEGSEKEIFESNYEYWLPRTRILIIELHDQMKKGCAKSFFTALSKFDFSLRLSGENFVCYMK